MKEKYLKAIVYFLGTISLCLFIAIRVPSFLNLMIKEKVVPEYWENVKYGELYYFNYISHFREDLPEAGIKYRYTPKHPQLNEADILTFGDSFFDFSRMTTFPERLGDTLKKRVFYARYDYPLQYLEENQYKNQQSKVIIYESAERYIHFRFSEPHSAVSKTEKRSGIRRIAANIRDNIFMKDGETRYAILLNRSYLTKDIYSFINTLKFDVFDYMPSTTPVYTLNQEDPWLFYFEEVDDSNTSFYYQHTDEEINTYCDNIADLRMKLKNEYNLDMIFLPMPSKYTIYHKLLNNDPYNNFLPRLYKGLSERNVPFVNVYDEYVKSDEILYYGTDTHWNKKGLDIALDKTLEVAKSKLKQYIALDSTEKTIN